MPEKLLFSTEEYDSIYQGPRPNGSCAQWMIQEYGKPTLPHSLQEHCLFYEDGRMFEPDRMFSNAFPTNFKYGNYEYKYYYELQGQEHIYFIKVGNVNYFKQNRHIGFRFISNQVIQDVKEGRCFIVIMQDSEGTSGTEHYPDFEIIELWRKKANLPPYSVVYITGNYLGNSICKEKDLKIKVIPSSDFEAWNIQHTQDTIIPFEPIDDKFLYLSYNRVFRISRAQLVGKYIEYNLLERGKVSKGDDFNWAPGDKMWGLKEETLTQLTQMGQLKINDDVNFNLASSINIGDHKQTFVSIVSETITDPGTLFLSEKTWKPIQLGHPFMILGSVGTLELLRQRGYKTFSKYWDESYDLMPATEDRIEVIVKNLEKLSKLSLEELIELRKEIEPILTHNLENFKKELKANFYKDGALKKLDKILRKLFK